MIVSSPASGVSHFLPPTTLFQPRHLLSLDDDGLVLMHLGRPLPVNPAVANYYRAALATNYTLAGLPLGWIFWRWGNQWAALLGKVRAARVR